MAEIAFAQVEETFDLLNPMAGFSKETQSVVVRTDPLLGHTSVYNPQLKEKMRMFVGAANKELLEGLVKESRSWCFFCPEKTTGVAKFPPEFIPEGTLTVGETILFPNLFAVARYHAVAIISKAHYLELSQFTPALLRDALQAFQAFLRRVYAVDPAVRHAEVGNNYLFPAGASLIHPHFQALATALPYTLHKAMLEACQAYFEKNKRAYHSDLVERERGLGQRYIAQLGNWHWLAPFAPIGSNELLAVHLGTSDLGELSEADLTALASGLSAALKVYEGMGHLSYNCMVYSTKAGTAAGYQLVVRILTRQNPYPNYRTDDFFLQKCLQTELIVVLPEELAEQARPVFTAAAQAL
eukprot:RCo005496